MLSGPMRQSALLIDCITFGLTYLLWRVHSSGLQPLQLERYTSLSRSRQVSVLRAD